VLKEQRVLPEKGSPRLKVLEVGAINTTLLDCPLLSVDAIDLHSRHKRIQQRDFFNLQIDGRYDLVVSSMVLNSVPIPSKRGEMLIKYNHHLKRGGHLCLIIPRSCLMTYSSERFSNLLCLGLGFRIVVERESPKLAFYVAVKEREEDHLFLRSWECSTSMGKGSHHQCQGRGWQKDFRITFSSSSSSG